MKGRERVKRFLAVLLAFVMVFTSSGMSILAEEVAEMTAGTVEYTAAVSDAEADGESEMETDSESETETVITEEAAGSAAEGSENRSETSNDEIGRGYRISC